MLHIVCCHFNPAGYQRPRENFLRFRDALNHPITMVEAGFDDQFHCNPKIAIHADDAKHTLWQKERLLNIGLAALPRTADKVAWIDADVLFDNLNWLEETEEQLDRFPIVQLFDSASMLGPDGRVQSHHRGKAAALQDDAPKLAKREVLKTGFAWAARREALNLDALIDHPVTPKNRSGGLFDLDIVGGGDSSMLSAWTGRRNDWLIRHLNPEFRAAFQPWAQDAWSRVRNRIGFVPGRIRHLYHGEKRKRQYGSRIQPLRQHRFDPRIDIALDTNGLLQWSSHKPALHQAVATYFSTRDEDEYRGEHHLRRH